MEVRQATQGFVQHYDAVMEADRRQVAQLVQQVQQAKSAAVALTAVQALKTMLEGASDDRYLIALAHLSVLENQFLSVQAGEAQ